MTYYNRNHSVYPNSEPNCYLPFLLLRYRPQPTTQSKRAVPFAFALKETRVRKVHLSFGYTGRGAGRQSLSRSTFGRGLNASANPKVTPCDNALVRQLLRKIANDHVSILESMIPTTKVHHLFVFNSFAIRGLYATRHNSNETQRIVRIPFCNLTIRKEDIVIPIFQWSRFSLEEPIASRVEIMVA